MDGKSARVWHVMVPGVMTTTDRLSVDPVKEQGKRDIVMALTKQLKDKYYSRYNEHETVLKDAEIEMNKKCWYLLKELRDAGKLDHAHFSNDKVTIRINPDEFISVMFTNTLWGDHVGTVYGWTIGNGVLIESHTMEFNVMASKVNPSPIRSIEINSLYRILKFLLGN